jgi:hypothetical protein
MIFQLPRNGKAFWGRPAEFCRNDNFFTCMDLLYIPGCDFTCRNVKAYRSIFYGGCGNVKRTYYCLVNPFFWFYETLRSAAYCGKLLRNPILSGIYSIL